MNNQQNTQINPQFANYNPYPIQPQVGSQTPFYSPPQPAGMVYSINSSQELNTIPCSMGTSFYLVAPENKIIMRTVNGGGIDFKEFTLLSTQNEKCAQAGGVPAVDARGAAAAGAL
jgi:hypothetical protein